MIYIQQRAGTVLCDVTPCYARTDSIILEPSDLAVSRASTAPGIDASLRPQSGYYRVRSTEVVNYGLEKRILDVGEATLNEMLINDRKGIE